VLQNVYISENDRKACKQLFKYRGLRACSDVNQKHIQKNVDLDEQHDVTDVARTVTFPKLCFSGQRQRRLNYQRSRVIAIQKYTTL